MNRALAVVAVMAAVITGCVSVAPASEQPSQGPSFGVTTPAPASPGTSFPSLTLPPIPTIPPLTLPPIPTIPVTIPPATLPPVTVPPATLAPATLPPATEPPATEPPVTLPPASQPPTGNDHVLFFDNMDDPNSGWETFDAQFASVGYVDSALRVTINEGTSYGFSKFFLDDDFGTLLVAAQLVPTGTASAGLLCVEIGQDQDDAYGVVFGANGNVIFVSIIAGTLEILEVNDGVGVMPIEGDPQLFGLACSGMSTGAFRMAAFGEGTGPLATYQSDQGPEVLGGVALYGEGDAGVIVDFTVAGANGIAGSADGTMTPAAEELLAHVPSLWSDQCVESPRVESETASVVCFLQQDGAGPELASYESYATQTDMDLAYQERVDEFGVEDTDSCDSGPINTTWHIDNETMGNLLCAPQQVGTRVDWTDNRLNILSSLIDFEGDYSLNYEAWQEAGPNP